MTAVSRRSVVAASLAGWAATQRHALGDVSAEPMCGVTAPEDLMREHGVLNRLMLVYEAAISPPGSEVAGFHEVLHGAASLIRSFIEDYHGMLEEKFLFPEFDRHGIHTALVKTLREQHRIGRSLTGFVLGNATEQGLAKDTTRAEVTRACRDFVRMFRAHEAWEDTELFPAFRQLVSPARLQDLGQEFEEIEHRKFGKDGFSETVRQVERLEKHVGIQNLDIFTASTR